MPRMKLAKLKLPIVSPKTEGEMGKRLARRLPKIPALIWTAPSIADEVPAMCGKKLMAAADALTTTRACMLKKQIT